MALEIGAALDILESFQELMNEEGPIVIHTGVYEHNIDDAPPGVSDLLELGQSGQKITIDQLIDLMKEVKKRADYMSRYGTYYYEGLVPARKVWRKINGKRVKAVPAEYQYEMYWGT